MSPDENAYGPEPVDVWVMAGVHGQMSILVHGGVVVLHTGSDGQIITPDELMMPRAPGRPMELTHQQARDLAHLILRVTDQQEPPSGCSPAPDTHPQPPGS